MPRTASSPPRPATTSSRLRFMRASIGNLLVEANLGQVDTACNTGCDHIGGGTMAYGLWRALVVLHRYLGVAVGLLMAVWFVSGIVMMYVGFPRLTEAERLRLQSPVPWQACCQFGERLLTDDQPIVLVTTSTQRFWNWLGTIPHWLYFTSLRNDVALWSQVVVWTSIIGTFLTVMGLVLGVIQFRRGRSPYRGLFYWHHVTGLVFGV